MRKLHYSGKILLKNNTKHQRNTGLSNEDLKTRIKPHETRTYKAHKLKPHHHTPRGRVNEKRTESSRISKSARSHPKNEPPNLTHRSSKLQATHRPQSKSAASPTKRNPLVVLKIPHAQPRFPSRALVPAGRLLRHRTAGRARMSSSTNYPSPLVRTAHQQPKEFGTQKNSNKSRRNRPRSMASFVAGQNGDAEPQINTAVENGLANSSKRSR
jgi:hypothetical protein